MGVENLCGFVLDQSLFYIKIALCLLTVIEGLIVAIVIEIVKEK